MAKYKESYRRSGSICDDILSEESNDKCLSIDEECDCCPKPRPQPIGKTEDYVQDSHYVHTDNNYTTLEKNKLSGIESGAEVNVQSDWNVTDTSSDAYIKNKPTMSVPNDGVLTITRNNTTVGTFTANQASNTTVNINVPTATSQLTNDSTYQTAANVAAAVSVKQDTLISGTNIKTINGTSLLGSGNLSLKTYLPFPNNQTLSGTLQEVVAQILAFPDTSQGTAYLGGIAGSCTPFGYGNVECKVEFMLNGLAVLSVNSSDIKPYSWIYNTWSNDYVWKKYSDVLPNPEGTSSGTLTSISIDGTKYNIEGGGGGSYTAGDGIEIANNVISNTIYPLVPSQASSSNQLADKNFVNSSIENVAAFYVTKNANGDPFATKSELLSSTTVYSGGQPRIPSRNDYCIVLADESKTIVETGETPTTRYLYGVISETYSPSNWSFQYIVNNTGLTAVQLAAVNSGITSTSVGQITTNQNNISSLNTALSGKISEPTNEGTNGQVLTTNGLGVRTWTSMPTPISDYSQLNNLPKINGVTLNGNKTSADIGINIPTKTSDLTNDSGFVSTEIFTAVYDLEDPTQSTSYSDVLAAYNAGKWIRVKYGFKYFELKRFEYDEFYFSGIDSEYTDRSIRLVCLPYDSWVIDDQTYLTSHQSLSAYRTSAAQDIIDSGKVDKVTGKGLSENDYTTTEKTKLAGIAAGAEVNVQSDWNQTNTSADDYIKNKPTIPTPTVADAGKFLTVNAQGKYTLTTVNNGNNIAY